MHKIVGVITPEESLGMVHTMLEPYDEHLPVKVQWDYYTVDGETYETDVYSYNPNGEWDWYELGGRWDGALNGANTCKVSEIENFIPYAFIAEEGYIDVYNFNNDEDEYAKAFKEYIADPDHANYYMTIVDCHI